VIDLHSHILPGLDDGVESMEDSLDFARAFVEARVRIVAATPHVRGDYPTTPALMEESLDRLQRELEQRSIPLEVLGGGEIALDYLELLTLDDLRRFGLAGNPSYLLLEFPYLGWPLDLGTRVVELVGEGVTPVLAHPERNPDVHASPLRLADVVRAGALVQITAASLGGRLGRPTRKAALDLIELGLAHLVSSDAHRSGQRLTSLAKVRREVGDEVLARWLVADVPASIVLGRPLPDRPNARPRRWRLGRAAAHSLWTRGN
jgi:protein-tyrosine phosphatase